MHGTANIKGDNSAALAASRVLVCAIKTGLPVSESLGEIQLELLNYFSPPLITTTIIITAPALTAVQGPLRIFPPGAICGI